MLHVLGIVHRDLAARNIMLGNSMPGTYGFPMTKIADFGLSRVMDDNHYKQANKAKMPIRCVLIVCHLYLW